MNRFHGKLYLFIFTLLPFIHSFLSIFFLLQAFSHIDQILRIYCFQFWFVFIRFFLNLWGIQYCFTKIRNSRYISVAALSIFCFFVSSVPIHLQLLLDIYLAKAPKIYCNQLIILSFCFQVRNTLISRISAVSFNVITITKRHSTESDLWFCADSNLFTFFHGFLIIENYVDCPGIFPGVCLFQVKQLWI